MHAIAVRVVNSQHGGFLRTFADAYLRADQENERILRPAWLVLVDKYGLDEECELAQGEYEAMEEKPTREDPSELLKIAETYIYQPDDFQEYNEELSDKGFKARTPPEEKPRG